MQITKLEKEDINQIILLEEETFGESLGIELLEEAIEHPNMFFICMKENKKVLGYIGAYIFFNECEILNFVVDKDYRSSGIGTKLISYFIDNKDINKFTLEVRVSNTKAINFYHRFGFKEISIRKNYYSNGEDAYLMILDN